MVEHMSDQNEISAFIWNVCDDVLRGLFKPHEYGNLILPFVVLRRLDCVLELKKDQVYELYENLKDKSRRSQDRKYRAD